MGLAFVDTRGKARNSGDVLQDLIGRLGDFKESATKTSVISKLLGDNMQGMARMGREELANLSKDMKDGLFTATQATAADSYLKKMAELGSTFTKMKHSIGNEVIPVLLEMATLMTTMGKDVDSTASAMNPGRPRGMAVQASSDGRSRLSAGEICDFQRLHGQSQNQ